MTGWRVFSPPQKYVCNQLLISYHNQIILPRITRKCFYITPVIDFADQVTRNSQEQGWSDMAKIAAVKDGENTLIIVVELIKELTHKTIEYCDAIKSDV